MEPLDTLRTALPGWTIAMASLDDDLMGFCDLDRQTIWVDANLTNRERRSTIMHEIVHALHGDQHSDNPVIEALVNIETARRLIHSTALRAIFCLGASRHPEDLADALDVDLDVFDTRMRHLDPDERSLVRRALAPYAPPDDQSCALCRWWHHYQRPGPDPCRGACRPTVTSDSAATEPDLAPSVDRIPLHIVPATGTAG